MPGKIKAGQGTLIGNAGEYYVVAELLKRCCIAALAPRNAPNFDILATNGDKTVRIRVKTKSEEYDVWRWVIKKDGEIFHGLVSEDDFTVLVNLTEDHHRMDYFVIPTNLLEEILKKDFHNWLVTPGKNGRLHAPDNKVRALSFKRYRETLTPYQNAWEVLWK